MGAAAKWIAVTAIVFITSSAYASSSPVNVTNTNTTPVPVYQTLPAYDPMMDGYSFVEGYCDTFALWGSVMVAGWVWRFLVHVSS